MGRRYCTNSTIPETLWQFRYFFASKDQNLIFHRIIYVGNDPECPTVNLSEPNVPLNHVPHLQDFFKIHPGI